MGYQYVTIPKNKKEKGRAVRIDSDKTIVEEVPSAFHLPEVCRQIYSEAALLGFKLNTFLISHWSSYSDLGRRQIFLGQRECITTVRLMPDSFFRTRFQGKSLRNNGFPNLTRVEASLDLVDRVDRQPHTDTIGLPVEQRGYILREAIERFERQRPVQGIVDVQVTTDTVNRMAYFDISVN